MHQLLANIGVILSAYTLIKNINDLNSGKLTIDGRITAIRWNNSHGYLEFIIDGVSIYKVNGTWQ